MSAAQIVLRGFITCQVCVSKEFTDAQVEEYANTANPTGIESKWKIVRKGSPTLNGDKERVTCDIWKDNVHILLEC